MSAGTAINEEAVRLAQSTPFSYSDWAEALDIIGERPGREALIGAARDLAIINGGSASWAAGELVALLKVLPLRGLNWGQ